MNTHLAVDLRLGTDLDFNAVRFSLLENRIPKDLACLKAKNF